jgi:hypothetical protein
MLCQACWSFIPKEVTEPHFKNLWADGPDRFYLTPTTLRSDPSSDTQENKTTTSSYAAASTLGSGEMISATPEECILGMCSTTSIILPDQRLDFHPMKST